MPATYPGKIEDTLADANLQLAIYTATGRLMNNRRNVVSPDLLPDYQDLRTQANAVKKHTLENLDHYLEVLETSVERNGGKVIFCRDGDEVADFILTLAKERGSHLIVKSKSMTTEEVHLNERLEAHQLEAVETDLGEYIIQLAHERPYHIVAPALHMTRYQVADLFTKKLGVEREIVVEKQTMIARATLREKFLAADIGITGANFVIAESGSIVVVENEGNARLTSSAPKIHIAIAGLEKLIPRAQDLPTFLKLLGRSSTGQPLTVYTSFLSGPRRAGRDRRPRRVLPHPARQWAHQAAGRSREARISLLHPLRRVPERVPRVPQDRRPQLSVGLFGAHRRHHHPAVRGHSTGSVAALRLQPVRRLRGSLPGQDRHSPHPARTAGGSRGDEDARRLQSLGEAGLPRSGPG